MGWQSVVCCRRPLIGSKEDGAAVWLWGKQQIGIGVGLGHVPNVERRNGGYWQRCVMILRIFFGGRGWVSGVSGVFGVFRVWSGGRAGRF